MPFQSRLPNRQTPHSRMALCSPQRQATWMRTHPSGLQALRRGFSAKMRLVRDNIARLSTALKTLHRWNSTIFIFHADHGVSLGEYGTIEKGKLLGATSAPGPHLVPAARIPAHA